MTCTHHYMLETPAGSVSKGVCLKCGAEKLYPTRLVHRGAKWQPSQLAVPLEIKVTASAQGKKAQAARKRTEKVCPICGQPYLAYKLSQATCPLRRCKQAWRRRGLRLAGKGKYDAAP